MKLSQQIKHIIGRAVEYKLSNDFVRNLTEARLILRNYENSAMFPPYKPYTIYVPVFDEERTLKEINTIIKQYKYVDAISVYDTYQSNEIDLFMSINNAARLLAHNKDGSIRVIEINCKDAGVQFGIGTLWSAAITCNNNFCYVDQSKTLVLIVYNTRFLIYPDTDYKGMILDVDDKELRHNPFLYDYPEAARLVNSVIPESMHFIINDMD